MRGSNLDINIAVNSDKARADLELLKAQFRATTKEIKALSNEAAKTGDRTKLDAAIPAARAMEAQLKSLNRTFAQTGEVAQATGNKIAISARSFRSFDQAVLSFGKSIGGAQAGLIAFGAVRVFTALTDQIEEARKKLLEIRDAAQQTAQNPAAIKAAQNIAQGVGRSADDATKMLSGVAESLAKVRTEAGTPINPHGVRVLNDAAVQLRSDVDQGVRVLRGADRPTFDLAKAYEMLGINAKNYKGTQEDILRLQQDVFTAFQKSAQQKLFDPVQLNEISKVLFKGLPADAALKILPTLLQNLAQEIEKNKQVVADIANQEALDAATARIKKMVDDQITEHNRLWTAVQTASANALANFVEGIPAWIAGWEQWKQGNKAAVDDMVAYVEGAAARIANALSQAFSSAKQTLTTSFPGDPSIPAMPNGNAAGGMIRGAGSGTSDSILARLSNGEFVMKARAVEHWGPRFMAALNAMQNPFGYHAGGLVRPRFADGGLVAAGGGTGRAVHLHLGGHEFALSGAGGVVESLVTEANRQRMRSGGLKPSWYGGRVSG
jgi:hypothetical protein